MEPKSFAFFRKNQLRSKTRFLFKSNQKLIFLVIALGIIIGVSLCGCKSQSYAVPASEPIGAYTRASAEKPGLRPQPPHYGEMTFTCNYADTVASIYYRVYYEDVFRDICGYKVLHPVPFSHDAAMMSEMFDRNKIIKKAIKSKGWFTIVRESINGRDDGFRVCTYNPGI